MRDDQIIQRFKQDDVSYLPMEIFAPEAHRVLRGEVFRVFTLLVCLANNHRRPLHVVDIGRNQISRVLRIGPASATRALRRLKSEGYIEDTDYGFRILKLRSAP